MSLFFIQGIAGAEGSPGKDGLVGERVRANMCVLVLSYDFHMH